MHVLVGCKTDTIAPHIHVLPRDIPFILNITPTPAPPKVRMEYLLGRLVPTITRLLDALIQPEQLSVTTNRRSVNRQYLLVGKAQQIVRPASLGTGA